MLQNDYETKMDLETRFRDLRREAENRRLIEIAKEPQVHRGPNWFSRLIRLLALPLLNLVPDRYRMPLTRSSPTDGFVERLRKMILSVE